MLAFTLFSEFMMCCFSQPACLYGHTECSGSSCHSPASTSSSVQSAPLAVATFPPQGFLPVCSWRRSRKCCCSVKNNECHGAGEGGECRLPVPGAAPGCSSGALARVTRPVPAAVGDRSCCCTWKGTVGLAFQPFPSSGTCFGGLFICLAGILQEWGKCVKISEKDRSALRLLGKGGEEAAGWEQALPPLCSKTS